MVVGTMSTPVLVAMVGLEHMPPSLPLPLRFQSTLLPLEVAADEALTALDCYTFVPVEVEMNESRSEGGTVIERGRTHDLKERSIAVRH